MEFYALMVLVAFYLRIFSSQRSVCLGAQIVSQSFISWDDLSTESYPSNSNSMNGGDDSRKVIVVSNDGTGDSRTVQGAVDMVPDGNKERVKIIILSGVYREKVTVPVTKPFISFIAKGTSDTVISWHLKASDVSSDGQQIGTYDSATVAIEADYFCANGITFENSATTVSGGNGNQAVALRLSGDKSVIYRCKILGNQDTLFDHTGKHYFFQSFIEGSIDFIFGNARSLYQECTLRSNAKSYGAIAASQRNSAWEDSGFSFNKCSVKGTGMVYLGRAWGRYARVIYSNCQLEGIILSQGWSDWGDSSRTKTVSFGEYNCNGEGANMTGRVSWARSLTYEEAKPYLDRNYINGNQWMKL